MSDFIEIPPAQLSEDLLIAVIEEFVTREGTDYGNAEYTLSQKVEHVQSQLKAGTVVIAYDPATESCTLLAKD